jgi:hypothetical protein
MKKIKKWLLLYDIAWLPPVLILIIGITTYTIVNVFGNESGVYAPGLISAPIIAAYNLILGVGVVNLVINLYHRGWFRKYYTDNKDIKDIYQYTPTWLKLLFIPIYSLLLLLLYCFILAQYV